LQTACKAHPAPSEPMLKQSPGAKPFGESNRYYRGRVLAVLRDHNGVATQGGVRLPSLGASVKPQFGEGDLPWLYGVVTGLAKDGLAHIGEERLDYDTEGSDPMLENVVVRLP
jgi:hypothetical protein